MEGLWNIGIKMCVHYNFKEPTFESHQLNYNEVVLLSRKSVILYLIPDRPFDRIVLKNFPHSVEQFMENSKLRLALLSPKIILNTRTHVKTFCLSILFAQHQNWIAATSLSSTAIYLNCQI